MVAQSQKPGSGGEVGLYPSVAEPLPPDGHRRWHESAACIDMSLDAFSVPSDAGGDRLDYSTAEGRAACARCKVVAECLEDALGHERREMRTKNNGNGRVVFVSITGYRGGQTAAERAERILRERR